MAIQGLRHSGNFATDERPKNWREGLLRLYPNGKAPLTALTSAMKDRSVDDAQYHWWEKSLATRRVALTTTIDADDTGLAMTGGGAFQFKAGDLLYSEHSREIMRVASDPASDTALTVVRAFSGTSGAAITVGTHNPNLICIGSAYEENSQAPTGVNYDPTKIYNYTQIFRNTLEMSRTAQKTRLRTVEQVKEAKREVLELHGIDMERAFFFGRAYETTLSSKPIRTTGGVLSFIDSGNVDTASSTTDMDEMEEWLKRMFDFGSSEKVAFCGNRALLVVQQIVRKNAAIQIVSGIKEFGMRVTRLICPFGELILKTHPLFNQMTSSAAPAYVGMEGDMVVLDMDNLGYVYLKESDTKYEPKLEENGTDGMKSGWITECGLEVAHPKAHFWIKGLTAGAADGA